MSLSQSCYKILTLTHAWLNPTDKHITTGRINQVISTKIVFEEYQDVHQDMPSEHLAESRSEKIRCRSKIFVKTLWVKIENLKKRRSPLQI